MSDDGPISAMVARDDAPDDQPDTEDVDHGHVFVEAGGSWWGACLQPLDDLGPSDDLDDAVAEVDVPSALAGIAAGAADDATSAYGTGPGDQSEWTEQSSPPVMVMGRGLGSPRLADSAARAFGSFAAGPIAVKRAADWRPQPR